MPDPRPLRNVQERRAGSGERPVYTRVLLRAARLERDETADSADGLDAHQRRDRQEVVAEELRPLMLAELDAEGTDPAPLIIAASQVVRARRVADEPRVYNVGAGGIRGSGEPVEMLREELVVVIEPGDVLRIYRSERPVPRIARPTPEGIRLDQYDIGPAGLRGDRR